MKFFMKEMYHTKMSKMHFLRKIEYTEWSKRHEDISETPGKTEVDNYQKKELENVKRIPENWIKSERQKTPKRTRKEEF
jgi:hypothetical protein